MTEDGAMEVWRLAHNASGPMTLRQAAHELGYASSRGVAKRISAAWGWFDYRGHDAKAAEIARTFTDQNGNWPWEGNWS